MVEYGKPATEDLDEKKGQNWIDIGGAALTLIFLLATCNQFSSTQKASPSNGASVSEQGKDDLVALKCTANGEEETFFPDKSEEKPITKEDIFIFDAKSNKLMDKSYAPIEAEIDDKRIVVKTKAEDINGIDKSGSTSEYFFAFDRKSLAYTYTYKGVSNMVGTTIKSYILAKGFCQKIAVPKQQVVQRNIQI